MIEWAEVNAWVAMAAIGLAVFAYAWVKGKQVEERTVSWMRDWE